MNGEKLFEIKEYWTYEDFKNVNIILQKKIRKTFLTCNVICTCLILYCLIAGAWLYFAKGRLSVIVLGGSLVGVILLFVVPYAFKKKIEEAWKAAPDCNGYEQIVEFYENELLAKRKNGEVSYPYDKFENMIDCSGYLYFLLSKNMAFTVQKDKCSEELIEFLNGKFASK